MTMPHLMNCSHISDGWCLDCVKSEYERQRAKLDQLRKQCEVFLAVLQWQSVKDALGHSDHAIIMKRLQAAIAEQPAAEGKTPKEQPCANDSEHD